MTLFTALSLADEYGIKLWIAALLDPEPITHGTSDPKKSIQSPPTFSMKDPVNGLGRSPEKPDGRRSTRGRSLRSASPMKKDTPSRKFATPRKPRISAATTHKREVKAATTVAGTAGSSADEGEEDEDGRQQQSKRVKLLEEGEIEE